MDKLKNIHIYSLFLLISAIVFWQLVFFVHTPKWDMIDVYYPWRFFIGECLQNHKFPFWNPYQDLGYPIHADPSSGAWYPVVWVIGYFFGYNIYSITIEWWLHIVIAAIGFYMLLRTLGVDSSVSFLVALCYICSGVVIGNSQHLTYIVSVCWLPFVINYYLKLLKEDTILNPIKAALCMFMLLTGGYPAFTFMLFYLLLIFFIHYCIVHFKNVKPKLFAFIWRNILFFILAIILSSGMLLSVSEVSPYLSRTKTFALEQALFGPFSPQSTISFLLPFAVIKNMDFYNTDLSMSNAYFGIIMWIFFLLGLTKKMNAYDKIFLFFSIVCLLASFGEYLPIRKFLFEYIPFMNLFRFPSSFRLFVIIGFLIIASKYFHYLIQDNFNKEKRKIFIVVCCVFIAFIVCVLIIRGNGYIGIKQFINKDLFTFSQTSTISQHIVFQIATQSIILIAFIGVLRYVNEIKKTVMLLAVIIIVELIFNAQLNEPYTTYYENFKPKEVHAHIKQFPSGFPMLPDVKISDVNYNEIYFGPFWQNLNIFQKQVSSLGFNSFSFSNREYLIDKLPWLYKATIRNRIAFLSNEIHSEDELKLFLNDTTKFTNKSLFLTVADFNQVNSSLFKNNQVDSIALIHFAPDSFIFKTQTKSAQTMTLLQNNYNGWKVFINDQESKIYTSNKTFMSAIVPAGENKISFIYSNNRIKLAAWISFATLIICLLIICLVQIKTSIDK